MTDILEFQIIDIISDDIPDCYNNKCFLLTIYGIDNNNDRVVVHVRNYHPYFYLKVPSLPPNNWDTNDADYLIKDICNIKPTDNAPNKIYEDIISQKVDIFKEFYGLQWDIKNNMIQKYNFSKICFKTHDSMKKFINLTKKHYNLKEYSNISTSAKYRLDIWRTTPTSADCDSNLYESSIHPIIRFIHDSKIQPTGWIEIKTIDEKTNLFPKCKHEYFTSFNDIKPIDKNDLSDYRIASFDIECDSLHGDFPQPKKNFKKLSSDIFDSIQSILKNISESRKIDFTKNISNKLNLLLKSGFTGDKLEKSYWIYSDINKLKIINNELPSDEIYNDIIKEIKKTDILDIVLNLDLKNKERDKTINLLQDIIENECDKINLKVEGDPIIQIGTVFYDYSSKKTYRHILVLGNKEDLPDEEICDKIDGIEVVSCKTEKELLLGWKDIIVKMDPDFITGYNIFGFDFKYIYDRAEILFPCKSNCNNPWWHGNGCPMKEFLNFGKIDTSQFRSKDHKSKKCVIRKQQLSSSALGDNTLNYLTMDGRILFDIQKEIQKSHNLESYKLDNVAAHFMRGKLKNINNNIILVSDSGNLKDHDFISFRTHSNIGEELFNDGKKYEIKSIKDKTITLIEYLDINLNEYHKVEWCLNKDDISPQDIFDKHKDGGSSGRAEVAKYCVQDCELCIHLLLLLDIIPNNLGMANVSFVPASFIFLRGQGVKVTSVVSKMCDLRNTRIPELKKIPRLNDYIKMYNNKSPKEDILKQIIDDSDWRKPYDYELEDWYIRIVNQAEKGIDGFEGAIVLDPKPGIYLDDPIAVLDYASLYPSSIIEKNISHETLIEDLSLLPLIGEDNYDKIKYQNWSYVNTGKGDTIEKQMGDGETTCYFLKKEFMKEKNMIDNLQEGKEPMGIVPAVLKHLLDARSYTKERMKKEPDEFKRKVLDGLQLAYKVTANSVYGQLGAKTSTIYKMKLAACTTSVGRSRIDDASFGVKEWSRLKYGKDYPEPDVIYGDTDSVFVKFSRLKDGKLLEGKEALEHCIKCGQEAGKFITKGELTVDNIDGGEDTDDHEPILCSPQDLEYEKTFWPFILISKKRYTGDKYEFDTEDCKRTSMGIVLKRRDNAQIVKHVFGNVIEKIMIDKDFDATLNWLKQSLKEIREGSFPLRYFVITKALRGYYKNPQSIAHKVLADRMAERDPGNKPKSNDRIPYAYIDKGKTKQIIGYKKIKERRQIGEFKNGKPKFKNFMIDDLSQPKYKKITILQGDRIEHIDYIKDKQLVLDYEFYITNQIMNPVKQVLDLEMNKEETQKIFSNE
jgi:DNA polymerase elongation subunit (family B)